MKRRYDIEEPLGAGGMGVVYRARDRVLGRQVALKKVQLAEGSNGSRDLVSEARALATISHANVVTVYDVGRADDEVFITMELVRGVNLRDWLGRTARTIEDIVEVFTEAGRGLAAAHAAGLVHGDFKPENVMVGDDGTVKVVDFGLAHPRGRVQESSVVFGTPRYMAPERHVGETATERSDQFAFCVALFEALYGRLPFSGTSIYELQCSIVAGEIDWPLADHVPAELAAVLEHGLARDSEHRYASMTDLLTALEAAATRPRRLARASSSPPAPLEHHRTLSYP